MTPQEKYTFYRLKDLLRWRTPEERPDHIRDILCWTPDVADLDESAWCGRWDEEDGTAYHPQYGDYKLSQITAWRPFVPGIDTPPGETTEEEP